MLGPRQLVSAPTFTDRAFGLLSVAQPRYDEPDLHWRNGVIWQDVCSMGGTTFTDPFCDASPAVSDKAANITWTTFGAAPFTVFAEVDCSPVGYTQQEERARAVDALTRTEAFQVEQAFWTGNAGGQAVVNPHLAASAAVTETNGAVTVNLSCAATLITGGVTLDIVEGISRLENAIAQCWPGQATIHVPLILAQSLAEQHMLRVDGSQMKLDASGNLVAIGAGYPGTSPNGILQPNVAWAYATGPIFVYRDQPETFTFTEQFDRSKNTLKTIVERTYVVGHGCCCKFAVAISLGGAVTGQPLSQN